jgi:hypothetical protein
MPPQLPREQTLAIEASQRRILSWLAVLLPPGAAIGTAFGLSSSRLRRGDPLIP